MVSVVSALGKLGISLFECAKRGYGCSCSLARFLVAFGGFAAARRPKEQVY